MRTLIVLASSTLLAISAIALPADAQSRPKRAQMQPAAANCQYYQDLTRTGPTGYGRTVCDPFTTRSVTAPSFWDFQDRRGGGTAGGGGGE